MTGPRWPAIPLAALLVSIGCPSPLGPATPCDPGPPCNPGDLPPFPVLGARDCPGDEVCIPGSAADALYLWVRDVQRWAERVRVCTGPVDVAGFGPRIPSNADLAVSTVVTEMTPPDGALSVRWIDCPGGPNAYYGRGELLICRQMAEYGLEVLRFTVAHEAAHALVDQMDLPFSGSPEAAADELAAVYSIASGRSGDAALAADFFERTYPDSIWWDDHDPGDRRARVIRCLIAGAGGMDAIFRAGVWHDFGCRDRWRRALRFWGRALGATP